MSDDGLLMVWVKMENQLLSVFFILCSLQSFTVAWAWNQFWFIVVYTRKIQRTTDLGSLIGNTRYVNFRIFLPLWFHVKSILVMLKPPKNCHCFLTIWAGQHFDLTGTFDIFKSEIFPKIKIQSLHSCQMTVFDLQKLAKIDFT